LGIDGPSTEGLLALGYAFMLPANHLRPRTLHCILGLCALLFAVLPAHAQIRDSALSEAEIEQVRETRYYPADCVLLFVKFLDLRVQEIQDLYAKPRRPGREQDTHDLLVQLTSIADELSDNLDDYGPRHTDIRKALPKILDATGRWSSALKSPPDDAAYDVARKIALESVRDLRESATELDSDQTAWFKLHPPSKQPASDKAPPIDIPR
jgi:hypothetical protein